MKRELKITGVGRLLLTPDIAVINFAVADNAKGYEESVKKLNDKVFTIHNILGANSINKTKLKTTDFRVHENWKPATKITAQKFIGFHAEHDLKLELPLNNTIINSVLSDLLKTDAEITFSISFDVADKEKYKTQLIQNAVADATESAKTIANAANIQLKEIININFSFSEVHFHNDNIVYSPVSMRSKTVMPDFSPNDIKAEKNITIIWKID
jgi:uncharacterized protein YggE